MRAQEVYMTAFTSESYALGVYALKKSLFATGTKHPLVILIPSDKAEQYISVLKKYNIFDKNCFYLVKPALDEERIFSMLKNRKNVSYWIKTFFKLVAASCTEFKKIVLLDSDLYIQKNIDSLFKFPHYSAVSSRYNGRLSSGVFVIEPHLISYKKLLNCIEPTIKKCREAGLSVGDQDVLREYFPNWESHEELILPGIYNCWIKDVAKFSRIYKVKPEDIYAVHFFGKNKPWNRTRRYNRFKIHKMKIGLKFSRAKIYSNYVSLFNSYLKEK